MTALQPKPNRLHRIIQQIAVLEPVTMFFSSRINTLDKMLYSATNGRHTFTGLLIGLPVLMITMTGAKTQKKYTIPLVGLRIGVELAIIASNFGKCNNPAWYYNLVANPIVTVSANGNVSQYSARIANPEEHQELWAQAVAVYPGYEEYQKRAGLREIPIFVLAPISDLETTPNPQRNTKL